MGCSSMVEQAAVNGKVAGSSPAVPVLLILPFKHLDIN